jgi:tetratricopeptide (TPR) repeat protein
MISISLNSFTKILAVLFTVLYSNVVLQAQSSALNNAIFAQRDGDLDIAKKYIDEASVHEKTTNNPKTWYIRGIVYEDLHRSTKPEYKNLAVGADSIAVASYLKTLALDAGKKGEHAVNASSRMPPFWSVLINEGVAHYTVNAFDKAIRTYELCSQLRPEDTTAYLYGMYAASSASYHDKSYAFAQKLKSIGYESARIYLMMIQYARTIKQDTVLAASLISQAYSRFPSDRSLLIEHLNQLLLSGQTTTAFNELNQAIERLPAEALLYFNRGVLQEKNQDRAAAIADYTKAIELDPQSFDSYFNLGALYFNEGVQYRNDADKFSTPKEAAKKKETLEKSKASFGAAIPYFESALKLRPDDESVKFNLDAARQYGQ